MSLRPSLVKSNSSPAQSTNSIQFADQAHTHTPSTTTHPGMTTHLSSQSLNPSQSSSRISIQLPDSSRSSDMTRLPSAMSNHHSGAGFPRTRTSSSGQGTGEGSGRYRRKVGFEAFEAGPAALFAYTCAVSPTYPYCFLSELTLSRPRARDTNDQGIRESSLSQYPPMSRAKMRWTG
jgi:hypothetical protein